MDITQATIEELFNISHSEYMTIGITNEWKLGEVFSICVMIETVHYNRSECLQSLDKTLEHSIASVTNAIQLIKDAFPNDHQHIVSLLTTYQSDGICIYAYLPLQEDHKQILKGYYACKIKTSNTNTVKD